MNVVKKLIVKYKLIGEISSKIESIEQSIECKQAELQLLNSTNIVYLPDTYAQRCAAINAEIRKLTDDKNQLEEQYSRLCKVNIFKNSSELNQDQFQIK